MTDTAIISPREKALERACVGTWDETEALVGAIIGESRHTYAWRPMRAAAAYAAADVRLHDGRVWMWPSEFDRWLSVHRAATRKLKQGDPLDAVGISRSTALRITRGDRAVSKVEALACAHYATGLVMPVQDLTPESFADWFNPRFGGVERVGQWLQLRSDYISDRLRGFDIREGQREAREPGADLVRALDWVWRCGPVCPPYGERPPVVVWPGQEIAEVAS